MWVKPPNLDEKINEYNKIVFSSVKDEGMMKYNASPNFKESPF